MNIRNNTLSTLSALVLAGTALITTASDLSAKPLKVYVMAGQSNMQGRARDHTLPHMMSHPDSAYMSAKMINENGKPRPIEDVWIAALGVKKDKTEKTGPLMMGYGYDGGSGIKIGPEIGFGITMQEHLKEPILIIKTTWGGTSLSGDFRPPSAGSPNAGNATSPAAPVTDEAGKTSVTTAGVCYVKMVDYVNKIVGDIKRVYPNYDAQQGYEIAGFMWLQGENDFGDSGTYPNQGEPGSYDEYTRLLACLIRDLRKEFKTPAMPCIIGVMGIGGDLQRMEPIMAKWSREFRKAMAATADIPEFKGNVAAVYTEKFWEPKLEEIHLRYEDYKKLIDVIKREQIADMKEKPSLRHVQLDAAHEAILAERRKILYPGEDWNLMETGISNAAYHYLGSYKIYSRIGKEFAAELIRMAK